MPPPYKPPIPQPRPGDRPGANTPVTVGLPEVTYFEQGRLREKLVDEEAETVAQLLADEGLTPTQLRAYYFEVLSLRRRIELELANAGNGDETEIFAKHRPVLKMLRAKLHYAKARGTIRKNMQKWLEGHVRAVKELKDFRAFCAHFEAVVAFHRGKAREGK